MTTQDIAQLRLFSQHIAQADFKTAEDVVSHMVALQAQDYPGALWATALRTSGLKRTDVEQAIIDRKIVRTWPMRGTLHLLAAKDVRWVVALLAPRATAAAAGRRRQLGIDEAALEKAKGIILSALSGGKCLSRQQLCMLLDAHGVETAGQRGIHFLRHFSETGLLCFGPHEGKQPTFVLVDEWLSPTPTKSRDEALGELAERYFTSHGPASLKDFIGWGFLTVKDAKRGIEIAGGNLKSTVVSGVEYWFSDTVGVKDEPIVRLLPGFDELMLGYKDRSAGLAPRYAERIVPGGNGMFLPTLIIDGTVHGTWKRTQRTSSQEITILPFDTVPPRYHAQIDTAVDRYGQYSDLPTAWKLG